MNFSVIVTVGPSLLNEEKLQTINSLGNCIFRINGAHANAEIATNYVEKIRKAVPQAKIMIDLPGNKVRTANLDNPIRLKKNEVFAIDNYNLNFKEFGKYLKKGDEILANDSIYKFVVEKVEENQIHFLSHSDGQLQNNKGLHLPGVYADLPFLFERDLELIKAGCKLDVDVISLSFVRNANDVKQAKSLLKEYSANKTEIFAKVETKAAVENLGEILDEVEVINVDRGDLSTDITMLALPRTQDRIIEAALRANKKIFLATQFLKNMEIHPVPLIAEVSDLHNTVKKGVSGIQLSEETAVGKHPVECVKLVFDVFRNSFNI